MKKRSKLITVIEILVLVYLVAMIHVAWVVASRW